MIGMVAYLSYLLGDYTGLSGIVCLFCCSVTMSHYALHNISKQQRAGTMSAFETLSFLSEGAIFVYVGLDALDPGKWKVQVSSLSVMPLAGKKCSPCSGSKYYHFVLAPCSTMAASEQKCRTILSCCPLLL